MADDLAAMIADIEDDIERSDTAAIRTKITRAVKHYQSSRFWFNESRDTTFNTVASQSDYTIGTDIPATFYTIDSVWVTFGSDVLEVRKTDYLNLEDLLGGTTTESVPLLHSYVGGLIRLYPQPDTVYSVRVTGHEKIAAPASDAEADNPWMIDAYDLIKARAMAKLFAERYRDAEGAAIQRAVELDALSELQRITNSRTGTGSFRPTQF
jgi:hypothetical protein